MLFIISARIIGAAGSHRQWEAGHQIVNGNGQRILNDIFELRRSEEKAKPLQPGPGAAGNAVGKVEIAE